MLQQFYNKIWGYIYQKAIDKNTNLMPKGFTEINPQLISDCLLNTNKLEFRINRLDELATRIRFKETLCNNAILQCNHIVKEVMPLLNSALSVIKQNIDNNQSLQNEIEMMIDNESTKKLKPHFTEKRLSKSFLKDGVKIKNMDKVLADTIYRFRKKQEDINSWLTQLNKSSSLQIEA